MANPSPRSTLLMDGRGSPIDQRELEGHIRALRRYAYALVGRSANADDFVQETLRRAISHLRQGKDIQNLRSYLLTILHNVRNDHLKHEKRFGKTLPLDEDLDLSIPPSQLRHIQCREVAEIIATLPEDQREVLLLVGLEGTSYLDATKILHIPIGTVMSRLNRGRNAIRNRLGLEAAHASQQRTRLGHADASLPHRKTDHAKNQRSAKGWARFAEGRTMQARPDRLSGNRKLSAPALSHRSEARSNRMKTGRRF